MDTDRSTIRISVAESRGVVIAGAEIIGQSPHFLGRKRCHAGRKPHAPENPEAPGADYHAEVSMKLPWTERLRG